MTKEVLCNQGKCFEVSNKMIESFDKLFEEKNIVEKIEKDLWKKNFYGDLY